MLQRAREGQVPENYLVEINEKKAPQRVEEVGSRVEINQCVGCMSGEDPTSLRHRAGLRTRREILISTQVGPEARSR